MSSTGKVATDDNDIIIAFVERFRTLVRTLIYATSIVGHGDSGKSAFVDHVVGRLDSGTARSWSLVHKQYDPTDASIRKTKGTFWSTRQCSGEHSGMVEDHLPAEVVLSGLLYFHRISDNKVAGTPSRNLNVFKKLRGRDAFKNVILVTVMWGEGLEDIGLQRDKELQHDFWKVMTNLGSTTHRFHFTEGSAWEIINIVLVSLPSERRPLLIQQKIADEHKPPHVTSGEIRVLRFISYAFLGIKRLLKRSNSGPKGNKDGVITNLKLAKSISEFVRIHCLREAIAPSPNIAQAIETMGETHYALLQLVEHAALYVD
ncbi:hypothetical protein J3A83DRAFT_4186004 [Scleroderma citrinum]